MWFMVMLQGKGTQGEGLQPASLPLELQCGLRKAIIQHSRKNEDGGLARVPTGDTNLDKEHCPPFALCCPRTFAHTVPLLKLTSSHVSQL